MSSDLYLTIRVVVFWFFFFFFFLQPAFRWYFFSHIDKTLIRWTAAPSAIFFVFHIRLTLPGIFLMCLSLPFLILPKAPTITGTVLVLRCQFFSVSISRFLSLFYFIIFFDWYVIISWHIHLNYQACFPI